MYDPTLIEDVCVNILEDRPAGGFRSRGYGINITIAIGKKS